MVIILLQPDPLSFNCKIYIYCQGGGFAVAAAHERPRDVNGMLLSAPLITASPDTATPFKVYLMFSIVSELCTLSFLVGLTKAFMTRKFEGWFCNFPKICGYEKSTKFSEVNAELRHELTTSVSHPSVKRHPKYCLFQE